MPATTPNFMANGTINTCRFVIQDTTAPHKVTQATANAVVIGISQEGSNRAPLSDLVTTNYAAETGQQLKVYGDGEVCLLEAGDTITAGNRLKADSVGRGVPIATTGTTIQQIGARALQAATAAGQKIQVQILISSERPALV